MTYSRLLYLVWMGAIVLVAGIILFVVGWFMGSGHRHEVIEAMKANETHKAALALAEWSKADGLGSKTDPVYLETLVTLHMKKGNYEAARYNLNRLIALKGKQP